MDLVIDIAAGLIIMASYAASYYWGFYRGAAMQSQRHIEAWNALHEQIVADKIATIEEFVLLHGPWPGVAGQQDVKKRPN